MEVDIKVSPSSVRFIWVESSKMKQIIDLRHYHWVIIDDNLPSQFKYIVFWDSITYNKYLYKNSD